MAGIVYSAFPQYWWQIKQEYGFKVTFKYFVFSSIFASEATVTRFKMSHVQCSEKWFASSMWNNNDKLLLYEIIIMINHFSMVHIPGAAQSALKQRYRLTLIWPRSTFRLSSTVQSVATGNQWSGPTKLYILWFYRSAPLDHWFPLATNQIVKVVYSLILLVCSTGPLVSLSN